MSIKKFLMLGIIPILFMGYGWYLGQLHQSMQDLAGILLFLTGMVGWLLSFLLRLSIRRVKWYDTWWANMLTGMAGCILVFVLIMIYARIFG